MDRQKVAVVTGGARGIGRAICDEFISRGVTVCTIDMLDNDYFVGDIADEQVLQAFAAKVIADHGKVDYLINNACLSMGGCRPVPGMILITCCAWASQLLFCLQSCS